jgi:hypothetical protein
VDWIPTARLSPKLEAHSYDIHWNASAIEQTHVDKAQIMEAFGVNAPGANAESTVHWQL